MGSWGVASILGPEVVDPGGGGGGPCVLPPGFGSISMVFLFFGVWDISTWWFLGPRSCTLVEFDFCLKIPCFFG